MRGGLTALLLDVMCRCKSRVTRHAEHLLPKMKAVLSIATDAARSGSSSAASDGYEAVANVVASYEVIVESPHVGKVISDVRCILCHVSCAICDM